MFEVDARHREDVGTVVKIGEFLVGNVAKEADGEIGFSGGGGAELGLVVSLALAADDPVFDARADVRSEGLQGLQSEELAFARVEAADGENDDFFPGGRRFGRDDGEVRAEGAGSEKNLFGGGGEMGDEQFLRVMGESADAGGPADELSGEPATQGAAGELEDFRAVKREHEAARAEGVEKLQEHHRHHRPRFRQIDGGVAEFAAVADQCARELGLAPEIVRALERKAAKAEGPVGTFDGGRSGLSPDFDIVAEAGAGTGNFFGEGRDTAPHRIKLVRNQKNRPGVGSRWKGGHALVLSAVSRRGSTHAGRTAQ